MFVCAYLCICVLVCLGRGIFQLACHQLFVGVFSSVSLKGDTELKCFDAVGWAAGRASGL